MNIKDFRSSWADGLAFCAIMHSFCPDKIPFDELSAEDKRKNFTLAFEVARYTVIERLGHGCGMGVAWVWHWASMSMQGIQL